MQITDFKQCSAEINIIGCEDYKNTFARIESACTLRFGKASFKIMRRTCKPLFWRATRPVNSTDCMIEGRYCLKPITIDMLILYFKKYFHSFTQSAVFTGRVAAKTTACTLCA